MSVVRDSEWRKHLLVHPHHIPAIGFVHVGNECADNCASKVSGVKRFCDIRAGELHDQCFAGPPRIRTIALSTARAAARQRVYLIEDKTHQGRRFGFEVQKLVHGDDLGDIIIRSKLKGNVSGATAQQKKGGSPPLPLFEPAVSRPLP